MLKFIKKTRKIKVENEVSLSDLQEAENLVIKDVQREILSSEKYAQLQKSLKLFFDENKILRCGGRLSQAPLEYGAKFPIILPGSHDVTKLIVRKCDETVGHNRVKDRRSQVGFGFVFTVSDSDSQFRIRKSNTKLKNLKAVLSCF